jgi:hypothetical protein
MYVFTGIFNPSTLGASTVNYMFFRNVKKIVPNFNLFFKKQFFVCVWRELNNILRIFLYILLLTWTLEDKLIL